MQTNTRSTFTAKTHEGAVVPRQTPMQELRRTVSACLLFEDSFYESGVDIAQRLRDLALKVLLVDVISLAVDVRVNGGLRHAPLYLLNAALDHPQRSEPDHARALRRAIKIVCGSRADMPGELLAMYWKDGKRPIAKVLKQGLVDALRDFSPYQLSKYAARGAIRLRDVLFLTHAKPKDAAQAAIWKHLADDTLQPADTWEVALSAGADKKATFERLLSEGKLGELAILRNLRNMHDAGVNQYAVFSALWALRQRPDRRPLLPFQFVAAARAVPQWEPDIELAMMQSIGGYAGTQEKDGGGCYSGVINGARFLLPGTTAILVDMSGSMCDLLSSKSTLKRADAAGALAILLREICERPDVYRFNNTCEVVPARRGFALRDALGKVGGPTNIGAALWSVFRCHPQTDKIDRVIVITDEQSESSLPPLPAHTTGYVMNVAANRNGVGWGNWVTISGFSENLVRFIVENERNRDS